MLHTVYFLIAIGFSPAALGTAQQPPDLLHDPAAKATALDAVIAVFLRPDPQRLETLIHKDAEWKDRGPGSAIELIDEVKDEPQDVQAADLREILFFVIDDLPDLKKRFPNEKLWNADRLPRRLTNGHGCLVVWRDPEEKRGEDFLALVVKKIGDDYRIVYLDGP